MIERVAAADSKFELFGVEKRKDRRDEQHERENNPREREGERLREGESRGLPAGASAPQATSHRFLREELTKWLPAAPFPRAIWP